jgi:uncharacterized membrane protein YphA (DoxX/SURF4 family)
MRIAMIIVSSLLTLAVFASGAMKLRKSPQVIEGMTHVGVKESQVPLLGVIEIAGGAGLLIGFATVTLGQLAAAGLVLYFLGAVIAHLRIKDSVKIFAPAAFLLVVSIVTFVLQVKR